MRAIGQPIKSLLLDDVVRRWPVVWPIFPIASHAHAKFIAHLDRTGRRAPQTCILMMMAMRLFSSLNLCPKHTISLYLSTPNNFTYLFSFHSRLFNARKVRANHARSANICFCAHPKRLAVIYTIADYLLPLQRTSGRKPRCEVGVNMLLATFRVEPIEI